VTAPANKVGRTTQFQFNGAMITIHPWFTAPLALAMADTWPAKVRYALAINPNVPTMWSTGDLPAFTASGIDPELLLELPWGVRHAAALESERGQVLSWLDIYGDNPMGYIRTDALTHYIDASAKWLNAKPLGDAQIAELDPELRAEYEAARTGAYAGFLGNSPGAKRQAQADAGNAQYADIAARNPQYWQR
jgi:hypothetical protein